jgi:hypothetical protein
VADGRVPIDNNWIGNQIRPIAIGRQNWLFAGSRRAGKRAAAIMSLIRSARLNGYEPVAYLKDVCRLSRRAGSGHCCRIDGGQIQSKARSRGDRRVLTNYLSPDGCAGINPRPAHLPFDIQ